MRLEGLWFAPSLAVVHREPGSLPAIKPSVTMHMGFRLRFPAAVLEAARLDVGLAVETIFKGEGPPIVIREDDLRAHHSVAKGVGGVLAARLRDLAGHVVRHVALVVQVDLLDAERVLVKVVGCCAHPGLPKLAVPNRHLHQALVVTVLDRRDGQQHVRAGHLGHGRRVLVGHGRRVLVLVGAVAALLAESTAGGYQRDLVHVLLAVRADDPAVHVLERAVLDLQILLFGEDDSHHEASVAQPRQEEQHKGAEHDLPQPRVRGAQLGHLRLLRGRQGRLRPLDRELLVMLSGTHGCASWSRSRGRDVQSRAQACGPTV
eukprot:scaffold4182_cov49-Phaeocystis_antarctica.AAC.2